MRSAPALPSCGDPGAHRTGWARKAGQDWSPYADPHGSLRLIPVRWQPPVRDFQHTSRLLVDVAVAIAGGAETISNVQALADQPDLRGAPGQKASSAARFSSSRSVPPTDSTSASTRRPG